MKYSKFVVAVSAFAAVVSAYVAAPAMAQSAPATETAAAGANSAAVPTRGQQVFTAAGTRIGRVISVSGDGSVRVSVDGALNNGTARLPADKVSVNGDQVVTSLTRGQVIALVR